MNNKRKLFLIVLLSMALGEQVRAQGRAFLYQGNLKTSNAPANGNYDFRFTLYSVSPGGNPIGGPETNCNKQLIVQRHDSL